MTAPLRGVVVCHGELATALVRSVEEITGIRDALVPVSNSGCDRGQLEERIVAAVGNTPAVVFVDMPSGSCLLAAVRRLAGAPGARVVTGVNLAMLLEFLRPAEAPARLAVLGGGPDRVLVLTGTVAGMTWLARASDQIRAVNLGGIHAGPGRREYLRYVYLTPDELADLRSLEAGGVRVTAQDLPTSAPVSLESLAS